MLDVRKIILSWIIILIIPLIIPSVLGLCGDNICDQSESFATCYQDCGLGCTGSCLDFGSIDFEFKKSVNSAPISFSSSNKISEPLFERNVNYQIIRTSSIKFPEFNVNSEGLPETPMVLEIRYKDVNDASIKTSYGVANNRIKVISKIDFAGIDADVLGLEGLNDGKWKLAYAFFPVNRWQRIKSMDGFFNFEIVLDGRTPSLPIDYIALHKVNRAAYDTLAAAQRSSFKRVDIPRIEPIMTPVWFSRNIMEPVYETSSPRLEEINRPLHKAAAQGEIVTFSFSIAVPEEVLDVSVKTGILANELETLPPLETFQVINDLKMWNSYNAKITPKTYGLIPDRIEKFSKINIPGNTAKRFWLTLSVPEDARPGKYNSNLVVSGSGIDFSIPISVDVLPFKLDKPYTTPFIYARPSRQSYSFDENKVLQNFADHLVAPRIGLGWDVPIPITTGDVARCSDVICYDFAQLNSYLDQFEKHGILSPLIFTDQPTLFWDIVKALKLPIKTKYELFSDPKFIEAYQLLITQLNQLAASRKIEFIYSVVDEPCGSFSKIVDADRLYRIIKETGSRTWVTINNKCLAETNSDGTSAPPEIVSIQPIGDLIDFKIYIIDQVNENTLTQNKGNFGYYTTGISHVRSLVYNRYLDGYYGYRTGATALGLYAYGDYVNDPYNDFDSNWNSVNLPYNDFVLAYPSWDGDMISTMAFEGVREGIIDSRYVATLLTKISQNPGPIATEAQEFLSKLENLPPSWYHNYYKVADSFGFENEILNSLSARYLFDSANYEIFDNIRSQLQNYILLLSPRVKITGTNQYLFVSSIKNDLAGSKSYAQKISSISYSLQNYMGTTDDEKTYYLVIDDIDESEKDFFTNLVNSFGSSENSDFIPQFSNLVASYISE